MMLPKPQAIWREQCEAAHGIKARYGLNAALDYLIAQKLFNHAAAAAQNADFARELPAFVAEVRLMFEPGDIASYLAQMEQRDREEELALLTMRKRKKTLSPRRLLRWLPASRGSR